MGIECRVPSIGCSMISRHVGKTDGPIFDAACGTGIIGEVLKILGYQQISGSDLSPAMLRTAETHTAYQRLYEHDLGNPIPESDNSFSAVVCFGSLGPGHAPADCLDEFIRITRKGGHVIFNIRAETYDSQELKGKVDDLTAKGMWVLVDQSPIFRSYYLV